MNVKHAELLQYTVAHSIMPNLAIFLEIYNLKFCQINKRVKKAKKRKYSGKLELRVFLCKRKHSVVFFFYDR